MLESGLYTPGALVPDELQQVQRKSTMPLPVSAVTVYAKDWDPMVIGIEKPPLGRLTM